MISESSLQEIGKFQRTHALKGELNVQLEVDDDFFQDYPWAIVDMEGIPTPFRVENIRPKGTTTSLIKLRGVDSEEQARIFINKPIKVSVEQLRAYLGDDDDQGMYAADFVGYTLLDTDNTIVGKIVEVDLSTDENPLFIVEREGGASFMMPVADDLIESFNPEKKYIKMHIPEGLTDL